MPDREKVITQCEWAIKQTSPTIIESKMFYEEILALLKEQEPMMVRLTTSTVRCPKCGKQITSRGAIHKEIKFCWKCGQAVKWE